MTHSTRKIPISGANAYLIFGEYSHMGTTTGAAGRRAHKGASLHKDVDKAFF
jgi:hypothetical protein